MPSTDMTLEEILDALYQKLVPSTVSGQSMSKAEGASGIAEGEEAAELEKLSLRPEFRKVIQALLEEGKRSDRDRKTMIETQEVETPRRVGAEPLQRGSTDRQVSLAVFYHRGHERHFSREYPMESPQRVKSIVNSLRQQRFFAAPRCTLTEAPAATLEDLLRVHDASYVDYIRDYSSRGEGSLPRNTYVTEGTWNAVLGAAGCALSAGEAVMGTTDFAFALTRPPGHHAGRDTYGGFCLFNNAAILASSRFRGNRVMILNIDAHASDGTKRIYYDDPRVLTVSLHQDPSHFFPREGWSHETGVGRGSGYAVNVPMPPGSGDLEYLRIFDSLVAPLHDQFKPDYLIVECGFDAHHLDPLTDLALTATGYHELGKRLRSLREGRTVFTLEGGYNNNTIGQLACTFISGLLSEPNPFPEEPAKAIAGRDDPLSYSLMKGPKVTKRAPRAAEETIQQLRGDLGRWWKF